MNNKSKFSKHLKFIRYNLMYLLLILIIVLMVFTEYSLLKYNMFSILSSNTDKFLSVAVVIFSYLSMFLTYYELRPKRFYLKVTMMISILLSWIISAILASIVPGISSIIMAIIFSLLLFSWWFIKSFLTKKWISGLLYIPVMGTPWLSMIFNPDINGILIYSSIFTVEVIIICIINYLFSKRFDWKNSILPSNKVTIKALSYMDGLLILFINIIALLATAYTYSTSDFYINWPHVIIVISGITLLVINYALYKSKIIFGDTFKIMFFSTLIFIIGIYLTMNKNSKSIENIGDSKELILFIFIGLVILRISKVEINSKGWIQVLQRICFYISLSILLLVDSVLSTGNYDIFTSRFIAVDLLMMLNFSFILLILFSIVFIESITVKIKFKRYN